MKKLLAPSLLATGVILAGCSAVDPGTAMVDLSVGAKADNTTTARTLNSMARNTAAPTLDIDITDPLDSTKVVGTLSLTEARIVIEEIELEAESEGEEEDLELAFEGPIIADLVNQTLTPELPTAEIEAGVYTELEVDVDKIDDFEAHEFDGILDPTDKMLTNGYSMVFQGEYTSNDTGSATVPFNVMLDAKFEHESMLDASLVLTRDSITTLSVNLDFTKAFNDIFALTEVASGVSSEPGFTLDSFATPDNILIGTIGSLIENAMDMDDEDDDE